MGLPICIFLRTFVSQNHKMVKLITAWQITDITNDLISILVVCGLFIRRFALIFGALPGGTSSYAEEGRLNLLAPKRSDLYSTKYWPTNEINAT